MVGDAHAECRLRAKREVRSVPGQFPKEWQGREPEYYWGLVRATMPPFFWNRIRQAEHGRCEWCNEALDKL
jgi:hypothetical protein